MPFSPFPTGQNPSGNPFDTIGQGISSWWNTFTGQAQKDVNAQNLQMTREQWAREDTAVQRRAADMKAAGINPALAAGSPAAAAPAARMEAPQAGNPLAVVGDASKFLMGLMQGVAQVQQTQAQTDLARVQADRGKVETLGAQQQIDFFNDTRDARVQSLQALAKGQSADALMKATEAAWASAVDQSVSNVDENLNARPLGERTNLGQVRQAELLRSKALAQASQWSDQQAEQNFLATAIAVKSAGLQQQFLEEMAKTNPGLADGLKKWFDVGGSAVASGGTIAGVPGKVADFVSTLRKLTAK